MLFRARSTARKSAIVAEPAETLLPAGRITKGIVRIGDTVRRPSKPSSPFTARLLNCLEMAGCHWAPRHLGEDALGRDMLTYMPGEVPPKCVHFSDRQIGEAARIVRQLHEVTRHSSLANGAVVCHNDPGPNNFVFRDDVPVALIDFDTAAPGDPLGDVGYMAWSWCISSKPERGPFALQAAQIRALADAYGLDSAERERLPEHIIERLRRNTHFWSEQLAEPGSTPKSPAQIRDVIDWSEKELQHTEAHRSLIAAALLR